MDTNSFTAGLTVSTVAPKKPDYNIVLGSSSAKISTGQSSSGSKKTDSYRDDLAKELQKTFPNQN